MLKCRTVLSHHVFKHLEEQGSESTNTRNEANDLVVACRTSEVRGWGRVATGTRWSGSTSARGRRNSRNGGVRRLDRRSARWGRGTWVRGLAGGVGGKRGSSRWRGGGNRRVGSSVGKGDSLGDSRHRTGLGTSVSKMLVSYLCVIDVIAYRNPEQRQPRRRR